MKKTLLFSADISTPENMEKFEGDFFALIPKIETYLGNEISQTLGENTIVRKFEHGQLRSMFGSKFASVFMETPIVQEVS